MSFSARLKTSSTVQGGEGRGRVGWARLCVGASALLALGGLAGVGGRKAVAATGTGQMTCAFSGATQGDMVWSVAANGDATVASGSTVLPGTLVTARYTLDASKALVVEGFRDVTATIPVPLGFVYEPGSLKVGSPYYGIALHSASDAPGAEASPDVPSASPAFGAATGYGVSFAQAVPDVGLSAEVVLPGGGVPGSNVVFHAGLLSQYQNTADPVTGGPLADENFSLTVEFQARATEPGRTAQFVGPEVKYLYIDGGSIQQTCPRDPGVTTVLVVQKNRAPVVVDDQFSTSPGVTLATDLAARNLLTNDYDPDDIAPTAANFGLVIKNTGVAYPTLNGGSFTFFADGTFTYVPPVGNRQGFTDCQTYTVEDFTLLPPPAPFGQATNPIFRLQTDGKVCVTVTGNRAPVAVDDVNFTAPTVPVSGNVLTNDTDVDNVLPTAANSGLVVTSTSVTGLEGGQFVFTSLTGAYTYTPPAGNRAGFVDCAMYTIKDLGGVVAESLTATAKVCVTVGANRAPVAVDDITSTPPDTATGGNVLDNDTDEDNATGPKNAGLIVSTPGTFIGSQGGTFTVGANGVWSFTPIVGRSNVNDCILYTIKDVNGGVYALTGSAKLCVQIIENRPPVAVDDVAATPPDTPTSGNVLANDTDVDNAAGPKNAGLIVTTTGAFTGSQGGAFTIAANGAWTFTPLLGRTGLTDCVPYTIKDTNGSAHALTANATLCVRVIENRAPVAVNDVSATPPDVPTSGNVLDNDTDVDNATGPKNAGLVVTTTGAFTGSQGGSFTIAASGAWTFTPLLGRTNLTDCVPYTIKDVNASTYALTANATLCVQVIKNRAPVAVDDLTSTPPDVPTGGNVLDNDTDVDNATGPKNAGLIVSTPGTFTGTQGGTFTIAANGAWSFTPIVGRSNVNDCVTYTIKDVNGTTHALTASAKLCVQIIENRPPVAVDDVAATPPDVPTSGNVLDNDTDVDNPVAPKNAGLIVTTTGAFTGSQGGAFTIASTGAWTFTPLLGRTGLTDCVPYTIKDTNGSAHALTANATLCVRVIENRPPVAVDDITSTSPDVPTSGNVLLNDTDVDNSSGVKNAGLVVSTPGSFTGPAGGTFTVAATGAWTYTPPAGRSNVEDSSRTRLRMRTGRRRR
jgi:large repetitive protein